MNILLTMAATLVLSCSDNAGAWPDEDGDGKTGEGTENEGFSRTSSVADAMADRVFGDYSRLIFPVRTGYWSGNTLEKPRQAYYNHIDPDKTVET